jgi:hypothetical protein
MDQTGGHPNQSLFWTARQLQIPSVHFDSGRDSAHSLQLLLPDNYTNLPEAGFFFTHRVCGSDFSILTFSSHGCSVAMHSNSSHEPPVNVSHSIHGTKTQLIYRLILDWNIFALELALQTWMIISGTFPYYAISRPWSVMQQFPLEFDLEGWSEYLKYSTLFWWLESFLFCGTVVLVQIVVVLTPLWRPETLKHEQSVR